MNLSKLPVALATGVFALTTVNVAMASSHREAPAIAGMPKVDGTDFYMFRSYETGQENFVTLIANYIPLQDAYGGPNYFTLDQNALYEIHIDNDGDAIEDISFQFRPNNQYNNVAIDTDPGEGTVMTTVPLMAIGGVGPNASDNGNLNVIETYQVTVAREGRRSSAAPTTAMNGAGGVDFAKPVDNAGEKTINAYSDYAMDHVQSISIPGCDTAGRVFVGQRREGFIVNLGEVFDLINLNPLGARDSEANIISDKNVTSLALEVPTSCLTAGGDTVIGAWTTASLRQARVLNPSPMAANDSSREGGAWTQVSRLGMPLVNEVVIGIDKKDAFNASEPKDDLANFAGFVTHPSLATLINILFPSVNVPETPRGDLVSIFVTGIPDFTQPMNLTGPGEMLRLNTAVAITPPASQNDLGPLGGDFAGFPNGRRPFDDVVDVSLAAVVGTLCGFDATPDNGVTSTAMNCGESSMPANGAGTVPNDGASSPGPTAATSTVTGQQFAGDTYLDVFPYLNTPIAGSPNELTASSAQ